MLEYYLPGLKHEELSDKEFVAKLCCLAMIRQREGKESLKNMVDFENLKRKKA
jgi:hypothetical protein